MVSSGMEVVRENIRKTNEIFKMLILCVLIFFFFFAKTGKIIVTG